MKNMLSKFGTKTVAGAVLVGATLMVGLGVVSNFSGDSQKAANDAALSHFGNSAYNSSVGGSSASRADLERQMSATQDGYSARFLRGKSDGTEPGDAFSSDGAYAEGVRADEGFVYGPDGAYGPNGANGAYANGDAYDPFGSTYEQGVDGMREANASTYDAASGDAQFQALQQAAAAAAGNTAGGKGAKGGKGGKGGKGAKGGKDGKNQVRPATQINKLASSSGGSSFGASGGGASGGAGGSSFGGGSAIGGNDSNTRALPRNSVEYQDSEAFKFGRAGGIGGQNVGFRGQTYKGGNDKGRGAAGDLYMAAAYSGKSVASQQDVGQKSLAEAAFDGSNPEGIVSPIEEGATIGKVANSLLDAASMGGLPDELAAAMNDTAALLEETARQQEEMAALQEAINDKYKALIIGALIMAVALFFVVKAAYAATVAWPLWIVAGVLAAAALTFVWCMLYAGDNSIVGMIKQMADEERFGLVNEGIDIEGKKSTAAWCGVGLSVILGLCFVPWENVISSISEFLGISSSATGVVLGGAGGAAGGAAGSALPSSEELTPNPMKYK